MTKEKRDKGNNDWPGTERRLRVCEAMIRGEGTEDKGKRALAAVVAAMDKSLYEGLITPLGGMVVRDPRIVTAGQGGPDIVMTDTGGKEVRLGSLTPEDAAELARTIRSLGEIVVRRRAEMEEIKRELKRRKETLAEADERRLGL